MLRAMVPLYELYGGDAWWYGSVAITFRLLETSFLVFIGRFSSKTLFATLMSVIALIVLREVTPWLHASDEVVAYAGHWLIFFWLFALLAYDAFAVFPGVAWGVPLVVLTLAFVVLVIKKVGMKRRRSRGRDGAT